MKTRIWFFIMAVLSCAIATDNLFAQCAQTVSNSDNTCSNGNNDCQTVHGCGNAVAFTASCTASYTIDVWVGCPAGVSCSHCAACAFITENGVRVGNVCTTTDICGNTTTSCKKTCSNTVNLTQGHNYALNVCLTYCPNTETDCDECTASGCKAYGCVRTGVTSTCY